MIDFFFQAGPIDNIVRKADRNGNIIALITYKHIESCDYAIRLFNGIKLFNQSLKVQQSQPGGQVGAKGSATNLASGSNTPTNQSFHNIYNRKSIENVQTGNELQTQSLMSLMFMQQQIGQNFQQFSTPQSYNRSQSIGNADVDYRTSRRNERHHERQHQQHDVRFHRNSSYHQRDSSHQDRDFRENRRSLKRSRSRSPLNKRRR